jgi:hypothetical protein
MEGSCLSRHYRSGAACPTDSQGEATMTVLDWLRHKLVGKEAQTRADNNHTELHEVAQRVAALQAQVRLLELTGVAQMERCDDRHSD